MATSDSPLLTALPPNTDYISYLTIVEQYLSEANLPVLHQVLQDETLTINIGWDLVQLLLPLLPASKDCLEVIARLGNPREVILKVTEALRLIEYDDDSAVPGAERSDSDATPQSHIPLSVEQFETLLSMLVTLHARIKTKYPSRFLSTTLQAILASFSNSATNKEDMVSSIVQTTKHIRGIRRPALPSRASSGTLSRTVTSNSHTRAEDPEAATADVAPDELALQTKLFQSFVTHVTEDYLTTIPEEDELSYMVWSTRFTEHSQPERLLPVAQEHTMTARFSTNNALSSRVDAVGQLASLSQDLKITDNELLQAVLVAEATTQDNDGEEEPPLAAADVSLSSLGSLLLYTTKQISAALYGRSSASLSTFHIFPEHYKMIKATLSADAGLALGAESLAVIDACLALGLLALAEDQIGEPDNDAQFEDYLTIIALLGSNCPDPALRGHAHYLASTILRSHPEDSVRFAFIRDVLENSPMDNLKPVAVGWLKGEVIEGVLATRSAPDDAVDNDEPAKAIRDKLDQVADLVFPSLAELQKAALQTSWQIYEVNLSFYLASLNFLYLLIYSEPLRSTLKTKDYISRHKITERFVQPLQQAGKRFKAALEAEQPGIASGLDNSEKEAVQAEFNVLAQAVDRFNEAYERA